MNKRWKSFLGSIDIRFLPMDIGRLVCLMTVFFIRIKKIYLGEKNSHFPLRGGAIIAANHTSFLDPFIINSVFRYRRHFWLAAEVLMKNKLIRPFLIGMGCIEINRFETDLNAIKKSVRILKSGRVLTVFPQGGIKHEDGVKDLKSGAVLMALQAQVPIVPLYTVKTKNLWKPYTMVIGEPIDCSSLCAKKMPSLSDMQKMTDLLQEKMNECKDTYEKLGGNEA